jgi:type III pantothenate kinase
MVLLFDIGNTHTHVGVTRCNRVHRQLSLPTRGWMEVGNRREVKRWLGSVAPAGAALCSVVPQMTPMVCAFTAQTWGYRPKELHWENVVEIGINYPQPETIGPDRLANAMAARARFGAPVAILDFGTAVTLDVVDCCGDYTGGVIAPGLSAMTDYLHEKTALLPPIHIREVRRAIGRSTEEAMLIGAVHGYRGLIRELVREVKGELGAPCLPVVATGGYARLMASKLPEITAVDPLLTLEGLRLFWEANSTAEQ